MNGANIKGLLLTCHSGRQLMRVGRVLQLGGLRADEKYMRAKKGKGRKSSDVAVDTAHMQTPTDLIAGGQAGDLQGLSNVEEIDSESVAELAAEGQSFEAGILDGVENAPDPDVAEVKTKELPEDDVPSEYLESN
jgi:hypothetical protein